MNRYSLVDSEDDWWCENLIEVIDMLVEAGGYDTIDQMLASLDVEDLSPVYRICWLSYTLPVKDKLKERSKFFNKCVEQARLERGETYANSGIFKGLE